MHRIHQHCDVFRGCVLTYAMAEIENMGRSGAGTLVRRAKTAQHGQAARGLVDPRLGLAGATSGDRDFRDSAHGCYVE